VQPLWFRGGPKECGIQRILLEIQREPNRTRRVCGILKVRIQIYRKGYWRFELEDRRRERREVRFRKRFPLWF
jgi:hypothetical protein